LPKRVRITSIGTPWFSVGWEYRESDADVVRRVFSFLEDRRVLYEPLNAQIFSYVGQSAAQIRQMLDQELGTGLVSDQLSKSFKAILSALRKFMNDLEKLEQRQGSGLSDPLEVRDQQVLALGEMRGRVNPILASLAEKYRIEVEEELAAALQAPE
jgi:Family of unknown function (DUF6650)